MSHVNYDKNLILNILYSGQFWREETLTNLANSQAFAKIKFAKMCFIYCGNTLARHLTPKLNEFGKRKILVIQNFDSPKLPAIR